MDAAGGFGAWRSAIVELARAWSARGGDPALLRGAKVPTATTLARIEPHRLRALVLEDLRRYPASAIGEIHRRVGAELARAQLKRVLADLVSRGELQMVGVKRAARYRLPGDG